MSPLSTRVAREKFYEREQVTFHSRAPAKKTYVRTRAAAVACDEDETSAPDHAAIVRRITRARPTPCVTSCIDTRARSARRIQKRLSSESLIVCRFPIKQRRCQSRAQLCVAPRKPPPAWDLRLS